MELSANKKTRRVLAMCIAAVLLAAILLLQKLWGGEDAR